MTRTFFEEIKTHEQSEKKITRRIEGLKLLKKGRQKPDRKRENNRSVLSKNGKFQHSNERETKNEKEQYRLHPQMANTIQGQRAPNRKRKRVAL